jgi:DNA-binding transcriptional LysR family regulator
VPAASALPLEDLQLFAAVARLRSFSRAAGELGMPVATLSRRIAALERRLEAQLLRRTTRRVEPTDAGALLLERADEPLRALADALDCLGEESRRPRGRLRVTMPADFAHTWLARSLAEFVARHPDIRLELELTARVVKLVEEGFDVAIRAGEDAPTGLVARLLTRMPTSLYSSPAYLASLPPLRHPRDLQQVNALLIPARRIDADWTLTRGSERATVAPNGNLRVNDMTALIQLAAAGAGVALLPEPIAGREIEAGRLVPVLPPWQGPSVPIHLVYAARRMPLRLRLFLDHLRESPAVEARR